jgi:hypothetical protein
VPNTPITAAAVRLTANFLALMLSPLVGKTKGLPASGVPIAYTVSEFPSWSVSIMKAKS